MIEDFERDYSECSTIPEGDVCQALELVDGCRGNVDSLLAMERPRAKVLEVGKDGEHGRIVYASPQMSKLVEAIRRLGECDIKVLLGGETGVGKELLARAIHYGSGRSRSCFMAINCGAISDGLFESELFGHAKGAFTGASKKRDGVFRAVGKGTLFLDEIGELPLHHQAKLLRVLQEGKFTPVGDNGELDFNGRVICATNRDLGKMVKDSSFREDLYYRINVANIEIPPLRERREDIGPLVTDFLSGMDRPLTIHPLAMEELRAHPLKGNVRQLQNILRRAAIAVEYSGGVIHPRHLWD